MKMNKENLSSTVMVATNSVVNSLATFNFVLHLNRITPEIMESLDKNIPNYKKTIKFSEEILDSLTPDAKKHVSENLEEISLLCKANTEFLHDICLND